jgi:hypothetical protein
MKTPKLGLFLIALLLLFSHESFSQKKDSLWKEAHKNVIRYNLSSALLFGFDKSVVFGYERLIRPNQSISINAGKAGLPKFISLATDSFQIAKDVKNSGYHFSVDYRFYLKKENKYRAPHGLYIGPYYHFTQWNRDNQWDFINNSSQKQGETNIDMNINMLGAELGYQFIFWDRLAVDLIMIGPGVGWYNINAKASGNLLTEEDKEQLLDGVMDLITQKFPGFNYVFEDEELKGNGTFKTTSIGFRYVIHIGFNF